MCLKTKMIAPIRARKDIMCYKVMVEDNKYPLVVNIPHNPKVLVTPYIRYEMEVGKQYNIKSTTNIYKNRIRIDCWGRRYIDKGFFHVYTSLKEATENAYHLHSAIIQCIIPKGTLYYKSEDGLTMCAKSIILQKRILVSKETIHYFNT